MHRTIERRALLGTVAGAGIAALGRRSAVAQQAQTTLRFASLFAAEHSASRASDYLAEQVAKKTGGKVRIQVFHNAALGSEEEVGVGVKAGTIDMGYAGNVGFGAFMRDIRVLELPFLYRDLDEVKLVIDKVKPIINPLFLTAGFQPLGEVFDGPRVTLATRPLRSFADFKGLKFRVPQAPVYIEMVKAFGAIPTPVALPEVYTALQAHVAEALEGSATTLFTGKYYEAAKNLVRTDHIFYAGYFAINPATFARMTPDVQTALLEAGQEATDYNLTISKQANQDDMDRLVKVGVTVMTPPSEPFQAAVRPMNEKFAETLGGRAPDIYRAIHEVTKR